MKLKTRDFEHQLREELISSIGIDIDVTAGSNTFLEEEFGIKNVKELWTISLSKLQKIAGIVERWESQIFYPPLVGL
ncbi:MAG: hypothetical protein PHG83_01995 [Patescibacteria group bacterium]|jgi:hypothetical protein|nr:hypothetical protein [Patescibacteria group bacterium]